MNESILLNLFNSLSPSTLVSILVDIDEEFSLVPPIPSDILLKPTRAICYQVLVDTMGQEWADKEINLKLQELL